jgi:hypothetical protein
MMQDIIVIAGRHIIVGTHCPKCNKWSKTPITWVKTMCEHCKNEYDSNIFEEDKERYDAEIVRDALWQLITTLQTKHEMTFHVNDNHLPKALKLASLVKRFGIDMERSCVSSKNDKTGKIMPVNEIRFKKSEDMRYHIEKSLS